MAPDRKPAAAAPDDVDAAVAALYGGPLDEFISGRDQLARTLRGAGRRVDATTVKGLRKPKRIAWALDAATLDDPAVVERLVETVDVVSRAQDGDGDLRTALKALPAAQREMADAGARASAAAGSPVDPAELGPAVLAVVADGEALAALRGGRLVDIPPAGGFGLDIGAAPTGPAAGPSRGRSTSVGAKSKTEVAATIPPAAPATSAKDRRAIAGARRAVDRAESAAAKAGDRADTAEQAVREATAAAQAADKRFRAAQREAKDAQRRLDAARRRAAPAAEESRAADEAVADARAVLDGLGG